MTKTKMDLPGVDALQRHWGWLLGLGLLLLVMGCIGMGMVIRLTLVSMYFFAALLMISGVSHFIDAFKYKKWDGALWQIIIAILYLFATSVIFFDPFLASTVLTAAVAWILIVIGVTRIAMVIALKGSQGWGWLLLAGIAAIILGVLILMQWPISGLWVIGMFIAIDMIINGWTYIFIAIALRSRKN